MRDAPGHTPDLIVRRNIRKSRDTLNESKLMIACTDVHYEKDYAISACILFKNWTDFEPFAAYRVKVTDINDYIPGQFYRRELPCLIKVLDSIPNAEQPDIIIIDGYVWLDNYQSPGLGAYLYQALNEAIPVIGVAKNQYKQSEIATEITRGTSKKPLYVTAAGMDQKTAAHHIALMYGDYRLPTLLKQVDRLCRQKL